MHLLLERGQLVRANCQECQGLRVPFVSDLQCAHGRSDLSSLCYGSLEHISMMHSRRYDHGDEEQGEKGKRFEKWQKRDAPSKTVGPLAPALSATSVSAILVPK